MSSLCELDDLEINLEILSNASDHSNDYLNDKTYEYTLDSPSMMHESKTISTVSSLTESSGASFSRGYKGRLTTHHFNSSRISKKSKEDWICAFEDVMRFKYKLSAKEILRIYNGYKEDNNLAGLEGILINMLNVYKLPENMVKSVFRIENFKINRLKKGIDKQPSNVVTYSKINLIGEFLSGLPAEEGYPCLHRRLKKYITLQDEKPAISSWALLYKHKYIPFVKQKGEQRVLAYTTFHRYVHGVFGDYAFTRTITVSRAIVIEACSFLSYRSIKSREKEKLEMQLKI
jgi:hypothetical protein